LELPPETWRFRNGPAETLVTYGLAEEWAEGAHQSCMTCTVVMKLAGDNMRPEERAVVKRNVGESTIFGQHVYKDRNDNKSTFIKIHPSTAEGWTVGGTYVSSILTSLVPVFLY
jgi:hypothetical protein